MSSRSLNKVNLIGNLTRDPELRYTPQGTAVCTFGVATNRSWLPEGASERKEETEFHRIVAWNKLGELCSQLLAKGRKVYVEGRLSTRSWTGQDGMQRTVTEIVIDDMIILDSRKNFEEGGNMAVRPVVTNTGFTPQPRTVTAEPVVAPSEPITTVVTEATDVSDEELKKKKKTTVKEKKAEEPKTEPKVEPKEELNTDDIPF